MKRVFFLILLWFSPSLISAQASLDQINETRCKHTLNGMVAFSGWTVANLAVGTAGVLTTAGELQHFYEMNVYFNVINLGIAIPGLINAIKAKPGGLSFEKTVKETQKVKTLFLVNGILDFTYITAGFLMREIGHNNSHNKSIEDRLLGYGDSFIMQGSFLLLFDFIEFALHAKNSNRLDEHWQKISLKPYGSSGIGVCLQYNLNQTFKKNHW
ncbi:MAG: hypothetical protein MK207_05990 [Saprospiraceae bacterium]|nr:hypothetical protein [Saprospiraceae bacterium]